MESEQEGIQNDCGLCRAEPRVLGIALGGSGARDAIAALGLVRVLDTMHS
jgi:hypothetical protein